MGNVRQFHHSCVVVPTSKYDEAVDFYRDLFELEDEFAGEYDGHPYTYLMFGNCSFEILDMGEIVGEVPEGESAKYDHVMIQVEDCRKFEQDALARGCQVVIPVEEMTYPNGRRALIGFVRGPLGEGIEFFENL